MSHITHHRVGATPVVPIALGVMVHGTLTPEDESHRIIDHYVSTLAARFRAPDGAPARAMIDTADCYSWWEVRGERGGHSESVLGRWLTESGSRESVYLATKGSATIGDIDAVWTEDGVADWSVVAKNFVGAAPEVLRSSLAGSLDRLGQERIDLYYVHVDDVRTPLEDTLATLAEFVADGSIGAYGWSNVRSWRLGMIRALCEQHGWPQPVALQQQHTYLRRKAGLRHGSIVDDDQMDYLEHHDDIQLVAYSPILKGVYNSANKRVGHWAMDPYEGADAEVRLAALETVAAQVGCTPNQAVLAWMLRSDNPRVLPLIGPRTWDQYVEAIEALDVELSDEQFRALDEAGA